MKFVVPFQFEFKTAVRTSYFIETDNSITHKVRNLLLVCVMLLNIISKFNWEPVHWCVISIFVFFKIIFVISKTNNQILKLAQFQKFEFFGDLKFSSVVTLSLSWLFSAFCNESLLSP